MTTETLPTPDADYLTALLAWAETEHEKSLAGQPSEWDQESWFQLPRELEEAEFAPMDEVPDLVLGCGTACCLAGKVSWDAGGRPLLKKSHFDDFSYFSTSIVAFPDGSQAPVNTFAQDHLGLSDEEADVLFSGSNTIEDLRVLIPAIISGNFREDGDLEDFRDEKRTERGYDGDDY